jgi:hypothetical protein
MNYRNPLNKAAAPKVRKSQRVQNLRENLAIESLILSTNGNKARPEKGNKENGQKQNKSKK